MRLRPEAVEQLIGARMVSRSQMEYFSRVDLDSRACSRGSLFVALKGNRTDGHLFLEDAWKRGAAGALVERNGVFLPDFTVLRVNDTEKSLRVLGQACARRLRGTRLAFTGTVGKTTIKLFFRDLLLSRFRVESTPRSFNTAVGMSVSLCNAAEDSDYYLLEAGISQPGEMADLAHLAQPDVVVFTPFGAGHLEGLKTIEQVASEKVRLICDTTRLVYLYAGNVQWPAVQGLTGNHRLDIVTFGGVQDNDTDIYLEESVFNPERLRSRITFRIGPERLSCDSMIVSPAVALLLGPAIHCAMEGGVSHPEIIERIEMINLPPNRETIFRVGAGVVVDDTYNANPLSMKKSLHLLDTFRENNFETWAVLGDMFELGRFTDEAHEELVRELLEKRIDRNILLGDALHRAADRVFSTGTGGEVFLVSSHEEVKAVLRERLSSSGHRWVVLFKGSRGMEMERSIPPEWKNGSWI